jgi:murein DD-endopeptidase MepM/ murein hydrolase activator NlpD
MSMNRPSPGRRPSTLAVALIGVGVGTAIGMLIGVLPFDSSSTSESHGTAEVAGSAPEDAIAPIAAVENSEDSPADLALPAVSLALAPAPILDTQADSSLAAQADSGFAAQADAGVAAQTEARAKIKPEGKATREASIDLADSNSPRTIEGVLKSGDTLASSLTGQGVSARSVDRIAREMIGYYDFRHSQPGHGYRLVQNAEGEVESFRYRISPIIGYTLNRDRNGDYEVARDEAVLWPRQTMVAGIVTSSLYGAITDLGAGPQLASDFSDVFAYDVDFSRMVRSGDEFRILYEQLYRTGENGEDVFVRPGRILAARYAGTSGEHTAVYFESSEGRGGYFRPDGSTVQREFLMAPVRYARITSRYAAARRHPILKITRPHHGIDYAAAMGTPVFAVAGGEVIYNSRAGGFGNLVKIRHDGGYVTYYGHLSRFADGLRVGQPVSQKQVIGYVGSTGLSTGPHVCFRVAKDGKYVNPIQLPTPESPPLAGQFTKTFQAHRDTMLASLDSGTLVAADEAL